jgi:lipopolysaccharide/colanic/teichoic acid biosynthesis glycosyltransferase
MYILIKRPVDLILSLLLLFLLSPIMFIVSLLILIKMGRPVLFKQKRVGKFEKPFIIFKFRTMVSFKGGNSIAVNNKNRVTTFGKYLRKYKIDEFPQLFNIIKGDMSLVGPRPDVYEYTKKISQKYRSVIFKVRPGLTGLDSVQYPDEEALLIDKKNPQVYYDEVVHPHKVRLNKYYVDNASFVLDFRIILYTLLKRRFINHLHT